MTDLPQLELLLVDAAVRRQRRRRVRRTGVRVLALAVAAAFAVFVAPTLVRDQPDHEIAAPTPAPRPPTTVADAYSVFRRAEQPSDKAPDSRPGDQTRLIAANPDLRAYLIDRGSRLCVATRNLHPRGSSLACGPVSLDPENPVGHFFNNGRGGRLVLAFADGVSSVDADGVAHPVRNNGVIIDVDRWPVDLAWMTPNGLMTRHYESAGRPTAESSFSALRRTWTPADQLDGFPGARRVYASGDLTAWLIPRRGAVCLTLIVAGRMGSRSACRHQLDDTRHPIILAMPHRPQHVIAMVFPDGATAAGADENGFLLIRNGEEAVDVRYTDPAGIPRVTRFPTSPNSPNPTMPMAAFVLHARAESPSDLDAP